MGLSPGNLHDEQQLSDKNDDCSLPGGLNTSPF